MPWTAGQVLTAAQLNQYLPQAWTSFVPNFPNLPLLAGSSSARYIRFGKLVVVQFGVTVSGGPSADFYMDLPVQSIPTLGPAMSLGTATIGDTGTRFYNAMVVFRNQSSVNFFYGDPPQFPGVNKPMTWASGDTIAGTFAYEPA